MAKFELKLPKMGESVAEATLTTWLKEIGDPIEMDEAVVEIATDKVDSEVPSEVEGVLVEKLFEVDEVVQVGETIAVIETDKDSDTTSTTPESQEDSKTTEITEPSSVQVIQKQMTDLKEKNSVEKETEDLSSFYSPLVKNIAAEEGISKDELENIKGTGKEGRVTKNDILRYIEDRKTPSNTGQTSFVSVAEEETSKVIDSAKTISVSDGEDEIIAMTRMGKMISDHMVSSVQTAAHVQSFIEVDVTNIWNWRNKVKNDFMKREGEKLTFTPIFMEVVAKAIKDYPLINISVKDNTIIKKKNINLGMATALSDGNLIVPVIKNADQLNLVGMTKQVNDLAKRARNNQLQPDDVQNGTYTVTNVGSFGSIMGTPIINQPQVAILALGAIRKVPAVIETPQGDFIGIRHKMFLSHSYDHRVVNGALGGMFIKRVKEYLETWDVDREF